MREGMIRFPGHIQNSLVFRRAVVVLLLAVFVLSVPQVAHADSTLDPIWGAPTDFAPYWLVMYKDPARIYTIYQLPFLAGHLIAQGLVKGANPCVFNGVQENGYADLCGLQFASEVSVSWQNRFDDKIISVSQATGIPPILLKNVFVLESQTWPQTTVSTSYEYGLGHMTLYGADALLRWNQSYYQTLCEANIPLDRCKLAYVQQPDYVQSMLRGLVIKQVNADCSNCRESVDLSIAENSIPVFANTLIAHANLVKFYIKEYTGSDADAAASYEDLWSFALASYNAGPGCFQNALIRTVYGGMALTWANLSLQLDPACDHAFAYVGLIKMTDSYQYVLSSPPGGLVNQAANGAASDSTRNSLISDSRLDSAIQDQRVSYR